MSQKDVVFEVIKEVLGDEYSPWEDMKPCFGWSRGSKEWRSNWGQDSSAMDEAIDKLVVKYKNKELVINKELSDYKLKPYLKNLIFNWLNKDRRLNGDRHYQSFKKSLVHNPSFKNVVDQKNWSTVKDVLGIFQDICRLNFYAAN
ncbi:MAG: hypothetical protein PHY93_20870 [Bacteriovorax sp.]|nr:hypothetical protein [Bacteriovorax sp.]